MSSGECSSLSVLILRVRVRVGVRVWARVGVRVRVRVGVRVRDRVRVRGSSQESLAL